MKTETNQKILNTITDLQLRHGTTEINLVRIINELLKNKTVIISQKEYKINFISFHPYKGDNGSLTISLSGEESFRLNCTPQEMLNKIKNWTIIS